MSEWEGRPTDAMPGVVKTRDEFGKFVYRVLTDFDGTGETEWENNTLGRFLEALAAVAEARFHHTSTDQEAASWQLFADMVQAATGYE